MVVCPGADRLHCHHPAVTCNLGHGESYHGTMNEGGVGAGIIRIEGEKASLASLNLISLFGEKGKRERERESPRCVGEATV